MDVAPQGPQSCTSTMIQAAVPEAKKWNVPPMVIADPRPPAAQIWALQAAVFARMEPIETELQMQYQDSIRFKRIETECSALRSENAELRAALAEMTKQLALLRMDIYAHRVAGTK